VRIGASPAYKNCLIECVLLKEVRIGVSPAYKMCLLKCVLLKVGENWSEPCL